MRRFRAVALLILIPLILAACGSKPAASAGDLTINDPWVRPAVLVGGNGAGYLTIQNHGSQDDALLEASADFCDSVEIHQTMQMQGDVMSMQPVDQIDIPAGGSATLEPGGYHLMLVGVHDQLQPGDTVTLSLTFEHAGTVQVQAEVRDQ